MNDNYREALKANGRETKWMLFEIAECSVFVGKQNLGITT